MRWRVAGLLALAAVPLVAADLPRLAIAPVRFTPKGDERVGARRSGLICAPAGSVIWREVGADGADLAARAAARVQARGGELVAANADRMDSGTPPSRMRLIATVERLHFSPCLPWRGTNVRASRGPVKGSGRLVVTWRMFDVSTRELVTKVSSCRDFTVKGVATLEAALGEAFADSAEVVVPLLAAPMRPGGVSGAVEMPAASASACAAGEVPSVG